MSRYLILLLVNLPFILMAIVSAITRYKLRHSSKRRMIVQLVIWLVVLIGLMLAQPFYEWLLRNGFTQTDPLSLFDVVQITAIVMMLYVLNRLRAKTEVIERRLNDFHQELSIILSANETRGK